MIERIEEVAGWLKKKWLGIALPLLGIPIIALGVWVIWNTTEDSLGVVIVVSGSNFMFGLFWLV